MGFRLRQKPVLPMARHRQQCHRATNERRKLPSHLSLIPVFSRNWTRERVTSLRSYHHIPVFKPADEGVESWLNLGNAAKLLKIAPKTLRLAAEARVIEAFHPLSEGPWIFARASLTTTAAQSIAERARQNPRYPAGSHPNQQSLFSSTT
jgi:hypothetical protein